MSDERNEQMFLTDADIPCVSLEALEETAAEQLGRLIERGDIRAIKLYYDLMEKERKRGSAGSGTAGGTDGTGRTGEARETALEEMADIRRAVFGEEALSEDRRRADAVGVLPGCTGTTGTETEAAAENGPAAGEDDETEERGQGEEDADERDVIG